MGLASSLFTGISGLTTFGNAMSVIGDNIANVNTIGFKASRVTFQDVLIQAVATTTGTAQIGLGTSLADISSSFAQGSFEATDSTTDLAIGGAGFFIVRDPANENNEYYTRAGEFRFDKDGNFINPAGYIVRGWQLDENGEDVGSVTDILLNSFTASPSETNHICVIMNLDYNGSDNEQGEDDSLSNAWDATDEDGDGLYIDNNSYEYKTTIKVYDSLGSTHDITIYFDKAETEGAYEFIVTCNPEEDMREGVSHPVEEAWAGKLARGLLHFDTDGNITDMDLWQIDSTGDVAQAEDADLSNGYFTFTPAFMEENEMSIELDFGSSCTDPTAETPVWTNDSLSTTQYASTSTTIFQSANGYGVGDLQSVTVGKDGVITGQYSNGQVLPLYRVALAKFQNPQALYKEGGNLYSETLLSGEPIKGGPGTRGLGNIFSNSLEQSNVDIATEFVKMITTQRGFQANSKMITVTDQMLAELLNLRR